jgi:uncharacterized protein YebE (UPF0316 family)
MDMLWQCLIIILARIADVSLGTVRTINVVQGRRTLALILGFFEVLIWILVVSRVIQGAASRPIYAVAYAFGFALGNYIGMTIEAKLALGHQVVRIFTRQGADLASAMRENGLVVTQFDGVGRDGPVQELFIQIGRRAANRVIEQARALDPVCYYMVDDVRTVSAPRRAHAVGHTGATATPDILAVLKRK